MRIKNPPAHYPQIGDMIDNIHISNSRWLITDIEYTGGAFRYTGYHLTKTILEKWTWKDDLTTSMIQFSFSIHRCEK